jgi:hypothetical protein
MPDGEQSVNPEHQRRSASDAKAAGLVIAVPGPDPANGGPAVPLPTACAQSSGIIIPPIQHQFPSLFGDGR